MLMDVTHLPVRESGGICEFRPLCRKYEFADSISGIRYANRVCNGQQIRARTLGASATRDEKRS